MLQADADLTDQQITYTGASMPYMLACRKRQSRPGIRCPFADDEGILPLASPDIAREDEIIASQNAICWQHLTANGQRHDVLQTLSLCALSQAWVQNNACFVFEGVLRVWKQHRALRARARDVPQPYMLLLAMAQVRLLLLAAMSGEHILYIGPPGTAKSELGRRLAALYTGSFFERLLTRFTVPEVKLSSLTSLKPPCLVPLSVLALVPDGCLHATLGSSHAGAGLSDF